MEKETKDPYFDRLDLRLSNMDKHISEAQKSLIEAMKLVDEMISRQEAADSLSMRIRNVIQKIKKNIFKPRSRMKYNKFTVLKLQGASSGVYAMYLSPTGQTVYTTDFGFKENDLVEMWDFDGYAPVRIDVNGKTIWNEENRAKFWLNNDPFGANNMNPYKK